MKPAQSESIVKTDSFSYRRDVLCAYVYALLRVLEYASAWISGSENVDFKIALGKVVGLSAEDIFKIERRVLTLLADTLVAAANPNYINRLNRGAALTGDPERAAFLVGVLHGLNDDIQRYVSSTHLVGDAPTVHVLQECARSIETQRSLLAPFCDEAPPEHFYFRAEEEVVPYDGTEPMPAAHASPSRPAGWRHSADLILTHKSDDDLAEMGEHMRRWLHYVGIDVEINAMELCGRNIAEFRSMPMEFKLDMARQAWDETRHAEMMRDQLNRLGGDFGDYTYSDNVWNKYMLGETLAERLAIEQVFQEGNAVEANVPFAENVKNAGLLDLAEMLDYIDADELRHAYFGNKWLTFLCDQSEQRYLDTLRRAAEKLDRPLQPTAPLLRDLRRMARYPDAFIEILASAGQVA